MPHVDELTLLLIDALVQVTGTLVLGGILIQLIYPGRQTNPLGHTRFPPTGPGLLHLVGVFAAFSLLAIGLTSVTPFDRQAARAAGSDAWHVAQCLDSVAKLATCALMVWILAHYRRSWPEKHARRLRPHEVVLVSVLAFLVIMPISYLQHEMGQIIWQWIQPSAQPSVHIVLEAVENTAWGKWGLLQLLIAAIIVAPLAEELFFRGLLLQAIWRYVGCAWIAIVLSGVLFGLIHIGLPDTVLPLATMGIILGYVRLRYNSLAVCVLVHALFNARTMLFVLLNPELLEAAR